MLPGATFSLTEHPDAELNGELLVVRVRHEGQRQELAGTRRRPRAPIATSSSRCRRESPTVPAHTRQPSIPGIQTATVVGPSGEELQPDVHGRIKVQFHWDREGQRNEQSSCWVRAGRPGPARAGAPASSRAWGRRWWSASWRATRTARCSWAAVYNGDNPPPVALPGEKTKSTQRTDSSPGGGGFNEVRLEDAAGKRRSTSTRRRTRTSRRSTTRRRSSAATSSSWWRRIAPARCTRTSRWR